MRPIPDEYRQPARAQGTVKKVTYGGKYALVYLPQGETDRILYLIHGGGGNQESFFRPAFIHMVDHMIEQKELAPLVIVSPTYYDPDETDKTPRGSGVAVAKFCGELRQEILPAVEGYANLKPDRLHRAISGFSMGGVTTWYAFLQALDLFYWFLPLSGDCWICGEKGGGEHPAETAEKLAQAVKAQGISQYRIHAITGTKDIAYPNLDAQIKAMREYPGVFGEQMVYDTLEGGVHDYETIFRYLYNALPGVF